MFRYLRVEHVIFTDMHAPPVDAFQVRYSPFGTRHRASSKQEMLLTSLPSCIVSASWPLKSIRNDSLGLELGSSALVLEVVALMQFDDHLTLGDGFGRALNVGDDYQH
ncbi:hypothetical protein WJ82_17205 [Burkholderia ubonensis]|nr:hypothetical protein WJ82_17205 [Burkholderia ubonensis]